MSERNQTNITITLSPEEKKSLRLIAVEKDLTVSGLVREWLKEYQNRQEKKESEK